MNDSRVLVVDDSALMRELLSQILGQAPGLKVVGAARDPLQALPMLERLRPDVMTLDVEMPHQDGLTFLGDVMRTRPLPVVMVSSLTERGSDMSLKALELGAVDVVEKPKLDLRAGVMLRAEELVTKVRSAARARPRAGQLRAPIRQMAATASLPAAPNERTSQPSPSMRAGRGRIICIGASTGGTEALTELLCELPEDCPPVVIVQHMPAQFTFKFASRLDSLCRIRVREAKDGDALLSGLALIAPGGQHLRIAQGAASYVARLGKDPENTPHRPSVDVLFDSVAEVARAKAAGAILTGMGADGARGLRHLRDAGARTFAQDEATCVVFGMPKEAIACGGAERVLPLRSIASALYKSTS